MGDTSNIKVHGDYTQIAISNLPKLVISSNRSGRFILPQFNTKLLDLLNSQIKNIFYRDDNDNFIPCFSILDMYPSNDETNDVSFKVVRDSNHNRVIVYELYYKTDTPVDLSEYKTAVNTNNTTQSSNRGGGGANVAPRKEPPNNPVYICDCIFEQSQTFIACALARMHESPWEGL